MSASGPGDDDLTGSTPGASEAQTEAPVEVRNASSAVGPPSPSRVPPISRGRLIFVDALIAVTTLLLVVGMFAIWCNRLLFNPDNWSNTSTQLLQNPNIRSTSANYLVDQLYSNVNVPGLIKGGLPTQLQPLAAPAAGALRSFAVQGVELALARPEIQNLWAQANRAADRTLIAVVNGGKGPVGVKHGVVTLGLGSILDNVAGRLGLPSNLSAKLPPNIATLTVLKSNQLKLVQSVGQGIKGLALWLTILVPLLYALAIVLAPGHRRRTLMTVGWAAILAGIIVLLGRRVLESQVSSALTSDASVRPTIAAVVSIGTGLLAEVAGGVIFMGILLIAAGWFAGPAHAARSGRQAIAPFLREHPVPSYGITLGLLVLLFIWDPIPATGTPAGILAFIVLALLGTYLLRRQTGREFPDAQLGDATRRWRERIEAIRHRRAEREPAPSPYVATVPQQLGQLAELREHGDITPDEYRAAKAQLLHSG
jgi:hypothetical protein